jgi:uncharacterized alpha-E superfamily protein
MLSRVADALYWMGRYIERAENVTRLLLVTEDLSTEVQGLDEELAQAEWRDLPAIFPGAVLEVPSPRHLREAALACLRGFSVDPDNPYSTYFSLRKARENARSAREALTLEVFINLNETYRDLAGATKKALRDVPTCRGVLVAAQKGILSTVGAIEHTMSRDQGWLFLKLGEALERIFRTAAILRAKLPALAGAEQRKDIELYYTRWRSLLRSLSSLENYRKAFGARMDPHLVARFVLFDAEAPRSLRYGVSAVKGCLERISGDRELTPPARAIGKLLLELCYEDEEVLRRGDPVSFLDRALGEIGRTHDAIAAQYFGT